MGFTGVDCIQLCQILCPLDGDNLKITIFRDVTLCSSVERYQRFILKTEALHGFEPLEYYRTSGCHIPKQQSLNNCLTNFVPISSPRKAQLTHLVAGRTSRLQRLGVVPSAIQLPLSIEVDEIHKQLLTDATREARRMPAGVRSCSRCEHAYITARQSLLALQHSRPIMLLFALQQKREKGPSRATGFHGKPTFRASMHTRALPTRGPELTIQRMGCHRSDS